MLGVVVDGVLVVAGVFLVVVTLLSAARTVVVPRSGQVRLARTVLAVLRPVFGTLAGRLDESAAERVLGLYAPVALLVLPLFWLISIVSGFTLLFLAAGAVDPVEALRLSGSSLLTIGFVDPPNLVADLVAFAGAGLTLAVVVLLLVTYLPTLNSAFAQRERAVTLLGSRAGTPAAGVELLTRLARIQGLATVDGLWARWEQWFADVHVSHTSQPALVWFRSPRPDDHWVVAAGAVLDAAALYVACVDHGAVRAGDDGPTVHRDGGSAERVRAPAAELCIRAGHLCLVDVAQAVGLNLPVGTGDDRPDTEVTITREEFDEGWERMAAAGVPLVEDRDAAWEEWAGLRVEYDTPLLALARLTWAPPAPWTSDREPLSDADRED